MQLIGLARLTAEPELAYTQSQTAVLRLRLVYSYGQKGKGDQYKPSQFVQASLFGSRAESLQPYLKKGSMICVTLDQVNVRTYNKSDGSQGVSLEGIVQSLEFAGGNDQMDDSPAPAPRTMPKPIADSFAELTDDIPF